MQPQKSQSPFVRRTFSQAQIESLLGDKNWRRARRKHSAQILRDMHSGTWVEDSPDTIKFDDAGRLVDGQHRLMAEFAWQASGGTPHQFWCFYGTAPDAITTIDGGLRRSIADYLSADGVANSRNAGTLAGFVCRQSELHPNGGALSKAVWKGDGQPLSTSLVVRTYKENFGLIDYWASRHAVRKNGAFMATCLTAVPMFVEKFGLASRETASRFHELVFKGHELRGEFDPIFVLRRRMMDSDSILTYERAAFAVKTWNAWAMGREVKNLNFREAGDRAESFPQLVRYPEDSGDE